MFYNLLIVFLLVFSFPLPVCGNSIFLAAFLSFFCVFFNKQNEILFIEIIKSKYVYVIVVGSILLLGYSFAYSFLRGTYDFTRVQILISMLVGCFSTILVYASLKNKQESIEYIEKIIVYIFIIQTFIELLSFISPTFLDIVRIFQFEEETEVAEEAYAGFRGLAISGRLYFEFAATYGLIIIIQMKRIISRDNISFIYIIEYLLLIIGGFFAGRTIFVAVLFSIVLLLISNKSRTFKWNFFFKLVIYLFLFIVCFILLLPSEVLLFVNETFIPWVFDLFIKYYETGSAEESYSFNRLNEMYEVSITPEEWIIGAARYMNPDGSYYKHVDAGYLRNILYWGMIGSFMNIIYSLSFFFIPIKLALKKERNNICFFLCLIIYSFTLHYKGDLLGSCRFYYVVIMLYMLHFLYQKGLFPSRIIISNRF